MNAPALHIQPATRPLYLVACVGEKALSAQPARDLYRSDWFRKARAYVEALGVDWRILSAQHGLLHPDAVIEPYEAALASMPATERQAWAATIIVELSRLSLDGGVVFLAGEHYRQSAILDWLTNDNVEVAVPMRGLGIGQQKAFLANETRTIRECYTRRVRDLICAQLRIPTSDGRRGLGNLASLTDHWRADSLDLLNLTLNVEAAFDTGISDEDAAQLDSVSAIVDRLMSGKRS